jgi:hypothetical protein
MTPKDPDGDTLGILDSTADFYYQAAVAATAFGNAEQI